ncbi:MAG TPA: hypothetical protein VF530_21655 [Planctomycetota bacterium]
MLRRILLALTATVLALLVTEGALSLTGTPLLGRLLDRDGLQGFRMQWDEERFAAAARTPGPYRVHEDPLVSYTLKAEHDFEVLGGKGSSDALGLRRRPAVPGAPAWEDPQTFRIAVLGDSVAFGFGLDDADVLAARLEACLREVQGALGRPVACRTVAIAGWNFRNEIAFLYDHWNELDPDLVVHLPIENDLVGSRGVNETGQTGPAPDLGEEDPWLVVNGDFSMGMKLFLLQRAAEGKLDLSEEDLGPDVVKAGLSPTSTRRYDAMARAVLGLEAFLRERDRHLVLVQYDHLGALPILLERLLREGLRAPIVPFLSRVVRGDTLGHDPHPSPDTVRNLAIVIARELLARGLVERGEDRPLPPLDARIEERLAPVPTLDSCAAEAAAARAEALASLSPTIDWEEGRGVRQTFGNISPRGVVGTRLVVVVKGGRRLRIVLEPLAERPDLYPLSVAVEIGGQSMDPLRLRAGERAEAVYTGFASDAEALEVRLVPERWVVVQRARSSLLGAFQLVRIEALDP